MFVLFRNKRGAMEMYNGVGSAAVRELQRHPHVVWTEVTHRDTAEARSCERTDENRLFRSRGYSVGSEGSAPFSI